MEGPDCLGDVLHPGDRIRVEFGNSKLIGKEGTIRTIYAKVPGGPQVCIVTYDDEKSYGVYYLQDILKLT